MITDRHDFVTKLLKDYEGYRDEEKDKSFIYQYMKEKNDLEQKGKKYTDKLSGYNKIKVTFEAWKKKIITDDDYWAVYEKVSKSAFKSPGPKKSKKEGVEAAEANIERRLLIYNVVKFFEDEGFSKPKTESGRFDAETYMKPAVIKADSKYNYKFVYNPEEDKHPQKQGWDFIEMVYRFEVYLGSIDDKSKPKAAISREYQTACENLYEGLRDRKKHDYFVPLYIDSITGAGAYIIGSRTIDIVGGDDNADKNISDSDMMLKKMYGCSPCVAYFSELQYDFFTVESMKKLRTYRRRIRDIHEKINIIEGNKQAEAVKNEGNDINNLVNEEKELSNEIYKLTSNINAWNRKLDRLKLKQRKILEGANGTYKTSADELNALKADEESLKYDIDKLVHSMTDYDSMSLIMRVERTDSVKTAFDKLRGSDDIYEGYCEINYSKEKLPEEVDERFKPFFNEPKEKRFPERPKEDKQHMEQEINSEKQRINHQKKAEKMPQNQPGQ